MHAATLAFPAPPMPAPRPLAERYARCLDATERIRWDIDRDVIRGRAFRFDGKFLPDGLSRVRELAFLLPAEARFFSQVQGRAYAHLFGTIERMTGAKSADLARAYRRKDPAALEALGRFAGDALKHRALFERLERMAAAGMPSGYVRVREADDAVRAVGAASTWAVLALALDVEVSTQAHYRACLDPEATVSPLWTDVLLHHWKEGAQHAILDELEWRREHARRSAVERDRGVDDLIGLWGAIDGMLVAQARADAAYFIRHAGRALLSAEEAAIRDTMLKAYRWQHVVVGVQEPRYLEVLRALTTPAQLERIGRALEPILAHVAS